MRRILRPLLPHVRLLSLLDFPRVEDTDESGHSYQENARIKAIAAARATGIVALADDSGIEVDAVGRWPGIQSSRFVGPQASDEDRNREILRRLASVRRSRRGAAFVCAAAIATADGKARCVTRKCRGAIADAPRGEDGFGYDPIFTPIGWRKTFAQVTRAEKDAISHRGQAMRAAARLARGLLRSAVLPGARCKTPSSGTLRGVYPESSRRAQGDKQAESPAPLSF
jgi:XTP/dITP diphosphohydrolase